MSKQPLIVVGIGHDGPTGLSPEARSHLADADVLAGGKRQLDFFPEWTGTRIVLDSDVERFVATVRLRYPDEKTVVLASGDPLFYGIGRALLQSIPKEDIRFLPQISAVQLAFARVKESWHDARIVSVHGRPLDGLIPAVIALEPKIAILTDAKNHPAAIAALLRRQGVAEAYTMWVCENLGGPDERVSRWSPAAVGEESFSPLNVAILLREEHGAAKLTNVSLLGIPEAAILHQPGPCGMITRREVRLMALCYLELHARDVLWDVGAGSGSVSLEAANLQRGLQIFAIEREAEAYRRLQSNVERLCGGRVYTIRAAAPEAFAELPDPDAVFVGGSGGLLKEILQAAALRLRPGGRIVVNCITLESLSCGWEVLHDVGLEVEATSVQLAHSRPLGRWHNLAPDNPIFILRAKKQ
jgi:precorrin-6Y C5,15-methyltransferase (decarboxylating)